MTKKDKKYKFVDTPLGKILFFEIGKYIQYRNLTEKDIFWKIKPSVEFYKIYGVKPIETFVSKRINRFKRNKIKIKINGEMYQLAEKTESDGYLYEIPITLLRLFPKKEYPDMKFPYTRYHIASCRKLDRLTLERIKTEEIMRFNGGYIHSDYTVSVIIDAVYDYLQQTEAKIN